MNELRQDILTKEWILYTTERKNRPHTNKKNEASHKNRPRHYDRCPFCPGQESQLPDIIKEYLSGQDKEWQVRVVPNKYPVLTQDEESDLLTSKFYVSGHSYGVHEVIIETPRHDQDLTSMKLEDIQLILKAYHQRYKYLISNPKINLVIIFRNHGLKAGTSLVHSHSQIVALSQVSNRIKKCENSAQNYFTTHQRCLFCDMIQEEITYGGRLIAENKFFLAFIPFAAQVPFEHWIIPKIHQSDFSVLSNEGLALLGEILQVILKMLKSKCNDPDYNFVINTFSKDTINAPFVHWYLQIKPHMIIPAGFELGSGICINTTLPEANVHHLKQ